MTCRSTLADADLSCKFVLADLCIHTCSGMDSAASCMDMGMVTVEDEGLALGSS